MIRGMNIVHSFGCIRLFGKIFSIACMWISSPDFNKKNVDNHEMFLTRMTGLFYRF
jgi:hypothetical protein